jgi:hypothetical protein
MRSREVIRLNVEVKVIQFKVSELQLHHQSSLELLANYNVAQKSVVLINSATEV